jgi:uncharacterized FAD-dependent dehydrogenase
MSRKSAQRSERFPDAYDALVVGGGPAGLFAALGLLLGGRRTLIIEAGRPLLERTHRPGQDLVEGLGGAGLFSDGKLCMSLQVGGDLGLVRGQADQDRLLAVIAEALDPGGSDPVEYPTLLAQRLTAARDVGLQFTHYPVRHIGTERCASRIRHLSQLIVTHGGEFLTGHRVSEVTRISNGFLVEAQGARGSVRLQTSNVVLAMGKVGAACERDLSVSLGAAIAPTPMFIGVRIEGDQRHFAPLFDGLTDPKYKLVTADGSKVKTHCAAEGGGILSLSYNGFPLAGGHSRSTHGSGRSSVGILWTSGQREHGLYEKAMGILKEASNVTGGRLLVQRLGDYWSDQPSEPSLVGYDDQLGVFPGRMRDILPSEYFGHFDDFIGRLARLAPGIALDDTLMYGPSVEWWMEKVVTDEHMQAAPGLYSIGDGAGWSQGIVQAAGTGLTAAEHICGATLSADTLRRCSAPAFVG